jgi:hypothetical protein
MKTVSTVKGASGRVRRIQVEDKQSQRSKTLIIPLLIELVYKPVLGIHVTSTLTTSPSSNSTNKATSAVRIGTGVAIARGGSLAPKKIPERREYDDEHVLLRRKKRSASFFRGSQPPSISST